MDLAKTTLSIDPIGTRLTVRMEATFDTGECVDFTIRLPNDPGTRSPTLIALQRAALARARTLLDEADRAWSDHSGSTTP
jgi:hypothetical protein